MRRWVEFPATMCGKMSGFVWFGEISGKRERDGEVETVTARERGTECRVPR